MSDIEARARAFMEEVGECSVVCYRHIALAEIALERKRILDAIDLAITEAVKYTDTAPTFEEIKKIIEGEK